MKNIFVVLQQRKVLAQSVNVGLKESELYPCLVFPTIHPSAGVEFQHLKLVLCSSNLTGISAVCCGTSSNLNFFLNLYFNLE